MYKRKYSEKSNVTLVGLDKGFKTQLLSVGLRIFSLKEMITDVAVFCFLLAVL